VKLDLKGYYVKRIAAVVLILVLAVVGIAASGSGLRDGFNYAMGRTTSTGTD
jgi:hypothetical protein